MNPFLGFGYYAGVVDWAKRYASAGAWHVWMDPNEHQPYPGNWIGRVPSANGSDLWEHEFIKRGVEGGIAYGQYCQRWWNKAAWIQMWLPPNEPPATTAQDAQLLCAFQQGFAGYAHQHGRKVLFGAFSVTRPDEHTFALYAPGVACSDGLAVHEYARTDLRDPSQRPWFVFKYRWFVQVLHSLGVAPDVYVTELGLDNGTGWRTKTNAAYFGLQLRSYAQEAVKDPYVRCAIVFAVSSYSFPTFLIDETVAASMQATNAMLPATVGPEPEIGQDGSGEGEAVNDFQMPMLTWPVCDRAGHELGVVTQDFGERPEYYRQFLQANGQPYLGHNGRDIAVANYDLANPPLLYSPIAGEAWPYWDAGGYGNAVEIWWPTIKTGRFKIILGHMRDASLLRQGQLVLPGMVAGYMGSTGNLTGPHVHFGTKFLAKGFVSPGYSGWVDPRAFLAR